MKSKHIWIPDPIKSVVQIDFETYWKIITDVHKIIRRRK